MELEFLNWVHTTFHSLAWLNYIMKYISMLAEAGAICIIVCLILIIFKKTRRSGLALGFALVLDVIVVNLILKNVIGRERPWTHFFWAQEFYDSYSIHVSQDYSFPSGHTAVTFCAATLLVIFYKAKAAPAYIIAFLIGLSRIYLCEHYPTDVMAGMIIGSACGVGGYFAYKYSERAVLNFIKKRRESVKAKSEQQSGEVVEGDNSNTPSGSNDNN